MRTLTTRVSAVALASWMAICRFSFCQKHVLPSNLSVDRTRAQNSFSSCGVISVRGGASLGPAGANINTTLKSAGTLLDMKHYYSYCYGRRIV